MNSDLNNEEFKIYGMKIETFSIFYGLFLILWGVLISLISNSDSITSYIPSILGGSIFLFSYLSTKFISQKKLFMHIVVIIGLVIFLGGLDFIRTFFNGNIFSNYWADVSKLMMLITGFFFTLQCVRSFIHTRKMKKFNS